MKTIIQLKKTIICSTLAATLCLGCKESVNSASESSGSGALNSGPMTAGTSSSNTLFGKNFTNLAGVYLGSTEDKQIHEIILFPRENSKNICVPPSIDEMDVKDAKELSLVLVSMPAQMLKAKFKTMEEAEGLKVKIEFANGQIKNDINESKILIADKGEIDLKNIDEAVPVITIQASRGRDASIRSSIKLLNCAPARVNFNFPNLYSVTDSFKKYVEITLVAKETQGNIAAKKLTIQTDAREFPDSVAITPGSYLLNAKFISMKNNQPKVLAKSDDNMLLELKAGQEKKFKILLRD